jgi:hypothetical protein
MKKLLVTTASLVLAVSAFAQGTLNFANNVPTATPPINAPVFDERGSAAGTAARLSGSGFMVQLYARAAGTSSAFEAAGAAVAFLSGTGAGYWIPATRTANNVAPGSQAEVVLRAWRVSDGATWESAQAAGRGFGQSVAITVGTGGGGTPPALPVNLTGLTSFSLVPEPSTIALGIIGGLGTLMLIRRRK